MSLPQPLPLEEAQQRLLALVEPLPIQHVDVEGALGRYLAAPLLARRTNPGADTSAMDGYAVRSDDLDGPWRVVGESAAGHPCERTIRAGEAARISTGAALPPGSDTVILQEDVSREGDQVSLTGELPRPANKHIRLKGMDVAEGHEILRAGIRLGPAQVALAISAGHRHVPVRRMPRIAILDSGDELASSVEDCASHQIPASNGAMLAAMAAALPCETIRLGPVADDIDALTQALSRAEDADFIVTSGGASVGDHDLLRPALERWGARIDFWRVAIKPGKPLLVANRTSGGRRQLVLGLPGNPVSSHVTAYLFLLPMIRRFLGATEAMPRRIRTTLGAPVGANGARRTFLRAHWDGEIVIPNALQDSGALSPLAASNVLIDRPAHSPAAQAGDSVVVFLLQNGGVA
ncbi:MAG TPA: gephyrin-like molybdotransferase Glp [Novosphingobium sp.]|nr:gephyrin-like molybdotransferase Glp [Novosphingobium sp.]